MEKVSLVVPVYFEEEVITQFILETEKELEQLNVDYEYIFVDDGSADQTVEILRQKASVDKRIRVVVLAYNHGKAYSATAGFSFATGDYIIYMDPDLQDPPEEIPKLINEIKKGYDLVWGIREVKKDSFINNMFSAIFWTVLNKFTGLEIPKGIAVMRIFNSRFQNELMKYGEENRFIEGIFYKVGLKSTSVKIKQRERFAGQSKFNFEKKMKLAFDAIFDFSDLPLKMTVRVGFFISFLSAIYLIALIIGRYFIDFQSGWLSLIGVIILGLGIQLIFLGIIALYIGRIYKETKRRPLFAVREFINLNEEDKK